MINIATLEGQWCGGKFKCDAIFSTKNVGRVEGPAIKATYRHLSNNKKYVGHRMSLISLHLQQYLFILIKYIMEIIL